MNHLKSEIEFCKNSVFISSSACGLTVARALTDHLNELHNFVKFFIVSKIALDLNVSGP